MTRPRQGNIPPGVPVVSATIRMIESVNDFYEKLSSDLAASKLHILTEVLQAYAEDREPRFRSRDSKAVAKVLEDRKLVEEMLDRLGIDRSTVKDKVFGPKMIKGRKPRKPKELKLPKMPEGTPPENPFES